jgi:hypothetical protein
VRSEKLRSEWFKLQTAYLVACDARENYASTLRAKYGDAYWRSDVESKKLFLLDKAIERIYNRIFRWLDKNSPWDWSHGISANYICTNLTFYEATSETAPLMPVESVGYGSPQVPFRPARRTDR